MLEVVIKPCTHKQLAKLMGVSSRVLHTWLHPLQDQLGKRNGYYYSLEQMLHIYAFIGIPFTLQPGQRVTDLPLIEYPFE